MNRSRRIGLKDPLSDSMRASTGDVRRVSEMGSVRGKWAAKRQADQARRIAELEVGLGRLAGVIETLLEALAESSVVTKAALTRKLTSALSKQDAKDDAGALQRLLKSLGAADKG